MNKYSTSFFVIICVACVLSTVSGRTARSNELVAPTSSASQSLLTGSTVLMIEAGAKTADKIKEGDKVFSWNAQTKLNELKTVTKVIIEEATADELLSIQIVGEASVLGVTTGARFYARPGDQPNSHGDWTPADKLKAGDEIFTANGTWATVQSIGHAATGRTVFGLELEDNAPYYVGAKALLVQGSGE